MWIIELMDYILYRFRWLMISCLIFIIHKEKMMKIRKNILFVFSFLLWLEISFAYPTYDEYLRDFNKSYSSPEETDRRKSIYDSRIQLFATITEYTPGVNNFTDWTDTELNRLKSFQLSTLTEIYQDTDPAENEPSLKVSSGSVPESLDWRELKAVTSVKNQGECGSCWAFGVAAYIESKLIIERNYPITTDLSEQYLLSCTPGSDCGGGDPSVALQVVAKKGIPYESSFPYTPYGKVNSKICQATNMITEAGTRYRLIQNITDEKLIQLLQSGPVTVSISSERWHFYSSGVFSCPMNAKIDHGVLVVGYTNSTWIIKNQWGRSWGESGYMRLTRNRNVTGANCLIGMHVPYLDPVVLSVESYAGLISFSTVSLLVVLFALML